MITSNLLLKDRQGKVVPLYRISMKLGINQNKLLNVFFGKEGYTLKNAIKLQQMLKMLDYDFPVEAFLSEKEIQTLNLYLRTWGIQIKKHNPVVAG